MIKVTHIDHMGSDLSVVNAARVSFGKKSDWLHPANGKWSGLREGDTKLINYLPEHNHTESPFNHAFMTAYMLRHLFL